MAGIQPFTGDIIMKFETLLLHGLFAACLVVCVLTLGAMLTAAPTVAAPGTNGSLVATLLAAPAHCALPADGVICLRQG
jgi:hypothetical protein